MKQSRVVALAAISAAFAIIFLTMGAMVPAFEYSGIYMASMCTMLPLAKKSWKGGLMTCFATIAISFIFFFGVNPAMVVTFALFFGAHPTVSYLFNEKKFNKILALIIKTIWFVGSLLLIYKLFSSFLFEDSLLSNPFFRKYAYLIISGCGIVVFIIYDLIIAYFQRALEKTIEKLKI